MSDGLSRRPEARSHLRSSTMVASNCRRVFSASTLARSSGSLISSGSSASLARSAIGLRRIVGPDLVRDLLDQLLRDALVLNPSRTVCETAALTLPLLRRHFDLRGEAD